MNWRTLLRALDWFVSGSETYAREPSQRLAQSPVAIFGTNMFPGRRPIPAVELRSVDHWKLYSAYCCRKSWFVRTACMACFRGGKSRKQGMRDIHICTQKFTGKSVPETSNNYLNPGLSRGCYPFCYVGRHL